MLPVGYNNIAIEAAQARGVPVCTSPGYNSASVAEGALMMMLMLARRVHEQEVSLVLSTAFLCINISLHCGIHVARHIAALQACL